MKKFVSSFGICMKLKETKEGVTLHPLIKNFCKLHIADETFIDF